jgi:hypothetical protein
VSRLWIVSPTYFDVPSFLLLRERLHEVVASTPELAGVTACFVLIDDTAGRDPAIETVRGFADTRVIEPPFNLGHQRAIVFALRSLQSCIDDADLVATLDSDGQDRPEDLPKLLGAVLAASNGSRTVALARRTTRAESPAFKLAYLGFRVVFRTLTGKVVRSGNFAAYRGVVAKQLLRHPYFDLCYSSTFIALDAPIVYVPCPRAARYEGQSRMNAANLTLHGLRMLMPFLDRIAIRALILLSAVFAAGMGLLVGIVVVKEFTNRAIPGWATYTALAGLLLSLVALSSWLILFATFSQSRGVSLSNIDREPDGAAGDPPQ